MQRDCHSTPPFAGQLDEHRATVGESHSADAVALSALCHVHAAMLVSTIVTYRHHIQIPAVWDGMGEARGAGPCKQIDTAEPLSTAPLAIETAERRSSFASFLSTSSLHSIRTSSCTPSTHRRHHTQPWEQSTFSAAMQSARDSALPENNTLTYVVRQL